MGTETTTGQESFTPVAGCTPDPSETLGNASVSSFASFVVTSVEMRESESPSDTVERRSRLSDEQARGACLLCAWRNLSVWGCEKRIRNGVKKVAERSLRKVDAVPDGSPSKG